MPLQEHSEETGVDEDSQPQGQGRGWGGHERGQWVEGSERPESNHAGESRAYALARRDVHLVSGLIAGQKQTRPGEGPSKHIGPHQLG